MHRIKKDFIFEDVKKLKGIGTQLSKYLKNKRIEQIKDIILNLPHSEIDRSKISLLSELEIGKINTIKVQVKKLNFPRIRNLPNTIVCEDEEGRIDIIYFNSREGYLRKIFPLNTWVIVSGKVNFFRNKYQITNPDYVTNVDDVNYVVKKIPKYNLTYGINEKKYRSINSQVINNLPIIDDWLSSEFIKKNNLSNWNESISNLHNFKDSRNNKSPSFRRIVFDEICANFLTLSENRKRIKKKKKAKIFTEKYSNKIKDVLPFSLTSGQLKALKDINDDLKSDKRMFRITQGDVGSGKTIVALLSIANVIESNYQCALMGPTEILAYQHYLLAKKIFKNKMQIQFLSGKTDIKERKEILKSLENGKIDLIIGTHALFQKKIKFQNLGYVVIDEQHKFGVRQRKKLSDKAGKNCDVLVMSATPIPRTMIMTIYGDMDTSIIKSKPKNRKDIITYSKDNKNIDHVIKFVNKQISNGNQIFWVCPLIEESKKVDHQSSVERYKILKKIFNNNVGLLHGGLDKIEKEKILFNFLNKKIDILVSTTVIEVGIDFPNANVIVIENANKFGLSQLHQLRGRVGRGSKESYCILMFKNNLSENAKKRIKILKSSNDGFKISEEDMKLRGYGDLLGFKQSGIKNFRLADPLINENLFFLAEKEIKRIETKNEDLNKYLPLLKLYDRADILNDIV